MYIAERKNNAPLQKRKMGGLVKGNISCSWFFFSMSSKEWVKMKGSKLRFPYESKTSNAHDVQEAFQMPVANVSPLQQLGSTEFTQPLSSTAEGS